MPVDKFGRMSDTKTKDTGVSLTYINKNYIRSDGTTPVSGSINMRGNTLYNVPDPVNPQDVATKEYVDKRTHLIAVHASYHGDLIKGDYQFTFGRNSVKSYKKHDVYNGFLMPWRGHIKRFVLEAPGFKFSSDKYANLINFRRSLDDITIPAFTLVCVDTANLVYDLGALLIHFKFYGKELSVRHTLNTIFPLEKRRLFEGDILNIRSEINTTNLSGRYKYVKGSTHNSIKYFPIDDIVNEFYAYLATILIELDPL